MYNRYIRNDDGVYTRIPQEDRPPASSGAGPERSSPSGGQVPPPNTGDTSPPKQEQRSPEGGSRWSDGLTGMLRHFLDQPGPCGHRGPPAAGAAILPLPGGCR